MQQSAPATPTPLWDLSGILNELQSRSGVDAVMGGQVNPRSDSFAITELRGMRTDSFANLQIRAGEGLGGRALITGRPAFVRSYTRARGITHLYDWAVKNENIETAAAWPVMVDNRTRMVLYMASRSSVKVTDRWLDCLGALVRRVELDIAVRAEVARRIEDLHVQQATMHRNEVDEVLSGIADVAEHLTDPALRLRLSELHRALAATQQSAVVADDNNTSAKLSPRERDVIAEIAHGLTNGQVAESLGLLPNTVKAYLKSAMRKLHVTNRVQAIIAARSAGIIP